MFKTLGALAAGITDENTTSNQRIAMGLLALSKVQCLISIILILSGHFLAGPSIGLYALLVILSIVFAWKGRVKD